MSLNNHQTGTTRPCHLKRLVLKQFSTGFTLVELLVVMAIIALLIGLMLPALSSAIEAGRITQCLANERTIGYCGALYGNDNADRFPVKFNDDLSEFHDFPIACIRFYIDGAFVPYTYSAGTYRINFLTTPAPNAVIGPDALNCPSIRWSETDAKPSGGKWRISYGFNSDARGGWSRLLSQTNVKMSTVQRASSKVYGMDWGGTWMRVDRFNSGSGTQTYASALVPGAGAFGWQTDGGAWSKLFQEDIDNGRHNMQDNILYVDGHAATHTSAEMYYAWHKSGFGPANLFLYDRSNCIFSIGGN